MKPEFEKTFDVGKNPEGWYFESGTREQPLRSTNRFKTYEEAVAAGEAAGLVFNNGGWKRRLLMWNFNAVGFDKYPGWQIEFGSPAWCRIEHINDPKAWPGGTRPPEGVKGTKSSQEVAVAWDDIAKGLFYQNDISYDGSVSVSNGEPYGSRWWFHTVAERDRFLAWLPTFDKGIKVVFRTAAELPPSERAG